MPLSVSRVLTINLKIKSVEKGFIKTWLLRNHTLKELAACIKNNKNTQFLPT